VACGGGEQAADDCAATGVEERRDIRYASGDEVDPALRSLDLFVPQRAAGCGPVPVVAFVHGGGFRRGDKARRVDDLVRVATDEGWALASVNYRLVGDRRSGPDGAAYPLAEQDVAAAVGYLVDEADELGLDPERVALAGHSAGAFLAALVGTDPQFLTGAGVAPDAVRCVVALDTSYDIPAQVAEGGRQAEMFRRAFGDDPATWRAASPTYAVSDGAPLPAFLVVTRGSDGRVAEAEAFVEAVEDAGGEADLLDAGGLTHVEVFAAIGDEDDDTVTPALTDFLSSCD
jgi:acetyl esterase/lipase